MVKQIFIDPQKLKCYSRDPSYPLTMQDLNILQQVMKNKNWVSENFPQKGLFPEETDDIDLWLHM